MSATKSGFPSTPLGTLGGGTGSFSTFNPNSGLVTLERETSGVSPMRMNSLKGITVPKVEIMKVEPYGPPQNTLSGSDPADSRRGGLPMEGRCPPPAPFGVKRNRQGRLVPNNGANGTGGSSVVVAYLADEYDRRWVASQAQSPHTRKVAATSGGSLTNLETFEWLMTELEVLSANSQQSMAKLHVPKEKLDTWLQEAGQTSGRQELVAFATKVEEYWFEKRASFPHTLGTGLTPQLSRTPEESDGNGGLGNMSEFELVTEDDRVPLPFLKRTAETELWVGKSAPPPGPSNAATLQSLKKYIKTTEACVDELVRREELRLQHSEVTVLQLRAMRQRAKDGDDGTTMEEAVPQPSAMLHLKDIPSGKWQEWRRGQGLK